MLYCYKCGGRLPEEGSFCPYCGAKLPTAPFAVTDPLLDPAASRYERAPYENNRPLYGNSQPPCGYQQAQPPFGYNPAPYRYAPVPVQPPVKQAKPVDPMSRAYRLTTLGTLVTYGMVSQVSTAILSLAAFIFTVIFGRSFLTNGIDSVFDLLEDGPYIRAFLIVYGIAYVVGLLLGLLVSKTIRRRLPAQPPEQRSLSAAAFLRCVLAAFGLWGIGVLVGNFPAFIVPLESIDLGWNTAPTWVLAIVVAPIFEELIFRKLVLDRVGSFGEAPAVLCSALIFGLAHRNAGQFFLAFLLGILFARIYLRTGKIVYTMLLHFMINFTATFDEVGVLLWGEPFELWYLIGLGVLALAGIVLLIVCRRDPILGFPGRLNQDERRNALRAWPVTLVKWICVYSIIATGLLYCWMGLTDGSLHLSRHLNPLGLLYLIPMALAVVLILILARRPKRQPAPAAAIPYGVGSAPVQAVPSAAGEMQNTEYKMQNEATGTSANSAEHPVEAYDAPPPDEALSDPFAPMDH